MVKIEINQYSYTYPGSPTPALKNISLNIESGQLVGLIGASGAGKSSLLWSLAGLIPSLFHGNMDGQMVIDGMDTSKNAAGEFAGRVGLVLQNPVNQLSGMCYTVFEEIAWGLENLGISQSEMPMRINNVLKLVGLGEVPDRNPFSLSGGQQQRLALASILVLEPAILLLDEPTSMLDPAGNQAINEIIHHQARNGKTVVLASHHLEWMAKYADRVIALDHGELVLDGSPAMVLSSPILERTGIGRQPYTRIAEYGATQGFWPKDLPLPVTLEETVAGFSLGRVMKGKEES